MITENDVLLILNNDPWFTPSQSQDMVIVTDENGNETRVAKSYYHESNDGEMILIRVSQHGTALRTWIKRKSNPSDSLQNLSVVFADEPITTERTIEPSTFQDENGNIITREIYFVTEQYAYMMKNLSKKDFIKFINKLKSLNSQNVFVDPFRKKTNKKATRTVLIPKRKNGEEVPYDSNKIHPRQSVVVKNKDFEVDAEGNLIRDGKIYPKSLMNIMENVIARLMNEGFIGKDGLSGVERYEKGYDEFDPNSISVDDLIKYCQGNEFLYIYKGMNGLRISAANTNDIKRFIIKALYNCSYVKPTHDVDYLITNRVDEFEDCYVGVYEVVGGIDEPLYIVYQDWNVQE